MDSMQLDPETVDNLDAYSHIPPQLMEKCAALSVRPDTVRNLVQSMQGEQVGRNKWVVEVTCRGRLRVLCSPRTEVRLLSTRHERPSPSLRGSLYPVCPARRALGHTRALD